MTLLQYFVNGTLLVLGFRTFWRVFLQAVALKCIPKLLQNGKPYKSQLCRESFAQSGDLERRRPIRADL